MTLFNTTTHLMDPIYASLQHLECNPESIEYIGYRFKYREYEGLYITPKHKNDIVRFAFPKLLKIDDNNYAKVSDNVNLANSMVTESKFSIMGDEVWLIYERYPSPNEDYPSMVEHILENLKRGADLFYRFS